MIRASLAAIVLAAAAVAALALAGEPGRATVEWLGWRLDMTAAAAIVTVLAGAVTAVSLWRLALWVVQTPARNAAARAEQRRRQGADALTRGFLAVASGDGSEARRLAQKAAELAIDTPALARLLAAQAAEAAGEPAAAQAAYAGMLGFPEMRLAGLEGLRRAALAQGDRAGALGHAKAAYGQTRTARWAWRALLEDRLEAGDWAAALALVQEAQDRKIVPPISAERGRAALLAASAASLEGAGEARVRAQALDYASQAARLAPGFAPGVMIAVRLLKTEGKPGRAGALIEQGWKAAPHPALWLAWRDLDLRETPKARAQRLGALAALNPGHRESRYVAVERALLLRDAAGARAAAAPLLQPAASARACGLMARVAFADGAADEARAWMTQGLSAPHEPDWSDLDPAGRAFAYAPADWARLVSAYAETGELIHPRLERGEKMLTELPELPPAYEAASPFIAGGEALALAPDDPGPYA
jgi:HemY protein